VYLAASLRRFWDRPRVTIVIAEIVCTTYARTLYRWDISTCTNLGSVLISWIGVEIHEDAVQHCRESIERWKLHHLPAREIQHIEIIRGNALQIAVDEGEAMLGFDRIYVGASIDKSGGLAQMKQTVKPGGVLVVPGKLTEEEDMQLAAHACSSHQCIIAPLLSG
jgi:precorrin-6B methylase 2